METTAVGLAQGTDFSLIALFVRAHWVVQVVMIVLLIASIASWAIIIQKYLGLRSEGGGYRQFEKLFWSGQSLDDIYDGLDGSSKSIVERVFSSGMKEWRRSFDNEGHVIPGAQSRIEQSMAVSLDRELAEKERGLGWLATIGAIAPFVGLFGTVWGIKNSFEAIALSQNTNLSVVAPGIAEALVATALGLLAAIPAVIGYNILTDSLGRAGQRIENFSDEFSVLLSRQLQRGA